MYGRMFAHKQEEQKFHSQHGKEQACEEISMCARMITHKLGKDPDPLIQRRLPICPNNNDLFFQMSDGQILIQLINLMDPDAIDLRTINKYKENMNKLQIVPNIEQAITAAKGMIRMVGVNSTGFTNQESN